MEENKSARVVAKKAKKGQTLSTFIKGLLRRGSFHWRARNEALVAARVERGKYLCSGCQDLFGPKEVALDHIVPVVDPKVGFTTWDDYIARLFCEKEGFQILCNSCHDAKTKVEDLMREHFKTQREGAPDLTPEKKYSRKKKIDKPEEV
jgi:5-methylcytosine-specific restriction endonuclease McrA